MDSLWAATMLANMLLAAALVACKPRFRRSLWAFVGTSTLADWFCMANLYHLHDELWNVPWGWMDKANILTEIVMVASLVRCLRKDCWITLSTALLHLFLRGMEYLTWDNYAGTSRYAHFINEQGWMFFHMRQYCKLLVAAELFALILAMRNQRYKETECLSMSLITTNAPNP